MTLAPVNPATNTEGWRDELRGGPNWWRSTVDDHADLVGQRGGIREVVRDEQRRQAELAQQLAELGAQRRVVWASSAESGSSSRSTRVAGERARERDALALAAREVGGLRLGQVRDAEALEELVRAAPTAEGDVASTAGEGRARTPGRPSRPSAARAAGRSRRAASNQTSSPSAIRPRSGGRAPRPSGARSSCPRRTARRARASPARARGLRRAEGAKREVEVEGERVHAGTSLTARRRVALKSTSRAPIASANVEVEVELLVDRERERLRHALELPANMIVAPNSPRPRANASAHRRRARPAPAGARRGRTCATGRRRAC